MIVEKERSWEIYFNPFIVLVSKLWPRATTDILLFNAPSIAPWNNDLQRNAHQRTDIIRVFQWNIIELLNTRKKEHSLKQEVTFIFTSHCWRFFFSCPAMSHQECWFREASRKTWEETSSSSEAHKTVRRRSISLFCSYSYFIDVLFCSCKQASSLKFSSFIWEIKHFSGIKIVSCGDASSAFFLLPCCFKGVSISEKLQVGMRTNFG